MPSLYFGNDFDGIKKDAKVRYVGGWHEMLGFNIVYTVEHVEVYPARSDVYLMGFGDWPFEMTNLEVVEE